MKKDYKLIFVHGYTSSSDSDWYPAIKPKLDALGIDYVIPNLPGYKHPKSKEWLPIIDQEVKKTTKPIILIGHSLGTRAILLYLDQYQTPVEEVILIGPLSNKTENAQRRGGEAYPDFFEYEIDLNKVKKLAKRWLILHSTDDCSLDYQTHGVALSNEMDVPLLTFHNKGHFTEPEVAKDILEVLEREVKN